MTLSDELVERAAKAISDLPPGSVDHAMFEEEARAALEAALEGAVTVGIPKRDALGITRCDACPMFSIHGDCVFPKSCPGEGTYALVKR